jgi:hypothetical protein
VVYLTALSIEQSVTVNDNTIVNNELEIIWKETVMNLFKPLKTGG